MTSTGPTSQPAASPAGWRALLLSTLFLLGILPGAAAPAAVSVSAAQRNSCIVNSSNDLYCWGGNDRGQIGDGTFADRVVPTHILPAGNWMTVGAAEGHTCALSQNGALYCWGDNRQGELGLGAGSAPVVPTPTQVGSATYKALAVGRYHNCALQDGQNNQNNNSLWCWGQNTFGQVGDGTYSLKPQPTQIGSATNWTAITTGGLHTCALNSSTTQNLYCWGSNERGQLGNASQQSTPTPTAIGAIAWTNIAAGDASTCGVQTLVASPLAAIQTVMSCWGANDAGQLGNGTQVDSNIPSPVTMPVETTSHWAQVAVGVRHACADLILNSNGNNEIYCWGDNARGEVGNGTNAPQTSPVYAFEAGYAGAAFAAGGEHSCAATYYTSSVQFYCWGQRLAGQIGDGVGKNPPPSSTVDLLSAYPAVVAGSVGGGGDTTCYITTSAGLLCFGRGGNGQIGDGAQRDRSIPLAVNINSNLTWSTVTGGDRHFCALQNVQGATTSALQHTLWCWGAAEEERLGGLQGADQSTPVTIPIQVSTTNPVPVQSDWISIAAGAAHGCAIGQFKPPVAGVGSLYQRLYCWGDDTYGQTGTVPAGLLSSVVAPPVGGNVLSGNSISTPVHQVGDDTSLWQMVAAGSRHTCAIKTTGTLWCFGDNARGELGNGTYTGTSTPTQVGTATNWSKVYASGEYTCALKGDGSLWCWGDNRAAQLGIGTFMRVAAPTQVGAATTWTALALGPHHACGIQNVQGGELLCWGSNARSESAMAGGGVVMTPTMVGTNYYWRAVSVNDDATCAVFQSASQSGSQMACFGSDFNGQLGDNAAWVEAPVQVVFPSS